MEKLNVIEMTGRQIVQSLSKPMVENNNSSQDEVINSTCNVEYNTDSSSNSGTECTDAITINNNSSNTSGRKAVHFIQK